MRHNCLDCNNHEWDVLPNNFLSKGTRCPICSDPSSTQNRQIKQDKFVKEVYDLVGEEYSVLGYYEKNNIPILMRHNCDDCNNHEYSVRRSDFLNDVRCPKCFGTHQKTTEEFKKEVYDLVGNEYEVVGEYINNYTLIEIKHNVCNRSKPVNPNNFLRGSTCWFCSEESKHANRRKTHEEFVREVFEKVGNEYSVLGEYLGGGIHIQMQHNKCGNIYSVTPGHFLDGERCPECNEPKGEKTIGNHLNSNNWIKISNKEFEKLNNINKYSVNYYIPQKTFNGLIGMGGGLLSYDYYIPKFNLLIEFQGIQHEKLVKRFHKTEEDFLKQKEHDRRKKQYTIDNNINFLEIWYYDIKNTKQILESKLQELSTKQIVLFLSPNNKTS